INASSLGLPQAHSNGAMIVRTYGPGPREGIFLGTLDLDDHLGPWKTLNLNDIRFGGVADWSPDGSQIVYTAGLNTMAVRVRTLASGEDREVYRSSGEVIVTCLWARQHPKLFCGQLSGFAQTDIVSIALDSGRNEKMGSFSSLRWLRRVSLDD